MPSQTSILEELLQALGFMEYPQYSGRYGTSGSRKPSMIAEFGDAVGLGGYQPIRGDYGTPTGEDETAKKLKQLAQYLQQAGAQMPSDWQEVESTQPMVPGGTSGGSPYGAGQPQMVSGRAGVPSSGFTMQKSHGDQFSEGGMFAKDPAKIREQAFGIISGHANSGNRPSDIMARQMYEQDKRKEAIMEMMTSDNPARREQGLQMLQAMQTMYETERQPAVDQFKQAIEQLQGQTAQTEAQAQMQEAIGKQMQAEAVAGGPMAEVEAQLYTMQKLLDTIAPDAPPEQRMRLLLGMMQSIFGIDPSLMGISLEE